MSIYVIENEYLKVSFRAQGGELIELYDKTTQSHRLKRSDQYWSYYAPTLFPIVGRSFKDTIQFHGVSYAMEKHGFLRKSIMRVVKQGTDNISFELVSNEQTHKIYPFDFHIVINYSLYHNLLSIEFFTINNSKSDMSFQIGGHPAFHLHAFEGLTLENHFIEFNHSEIPIRHIINHEGYFTGEKEVLPMENQKLFLKDHFFEKDAIILKNLQSKEVTLKNNQNAHGVTLKMGFSKSPIHLGIWKPLQADFVCIEPWIGCADSLNFHGEFTEKETFIFLKPMEHHLWNFEIMVF